MEEKQLEEREGQEEDRDKEEGEQGEKGCSFRMYFGELDGYENGFKVPGKEKWWFGLTNQVED